MGVLKTFSPGLGMLVHIIILDLAEIPVVGIYQLHKHLRIPVVRKSHLADLTAFLLLFQPVQNP